MTHDPTMFYLKYWMSPSRLANYRAYWRVSLESCSVIQDTLCANGGVPQEIQDAMEKLCRIMQILIIEHLTSALLITWGNVSTAGDVSRTAGDVSTARDAIHSAYTYLTKSRFTSEDVAESCKSYLLKYPSSLAFVIDKIVLMCLCRFITPMQPTYRRRIKVR